jgi:hypothetical protein
MEGKLIKKENHYYFWSNDWNPNKNKGFIANSEGTVDYKLSKENCDEIFGVLDVETLSDEYSHDSIWFNKRGTYNNQEFFEFIAKKSFTEGFNKAMELNDKLFTVEDLYRVFLINSAGNNTTLRHFFEETVLPMFEQSTEIEVDVRCWIGNGDKESDSFKDPLVTNTGIPKLDDDGCLILRRIKC